MSKKVLLIEYEPRYVERLTGLLAPPEYQVSVAHDGEDGLAQFAASRFDLVLLSGMLPRLPSAEVIREIRKKGGAIAPPILLMMTGYKGSNPKADAQKVGAFDILSRPFTDETLLESVHGALEDTDVGAKTMRIAIPAAAALPLTASDIFSDVLDDLADPASRPTAVPPPPPRPGASAEEEVEKRLRDTLSGILAPRASRATVAASIPTPPAMPAVPPGGTPPHGTARFSREADIDKMISDTLSGIGVTPRPGYTRTPTPGTLTPPPFARPVAVPPASESIPTPPPQRAAEPAPISGSGPDRFGQYQLIERIASGGMAELYKARRTGVEGFQKIVAIKKILPHMADNEEFIAMFADEAKLAAQLNHPNIVHIYDLGKIEEGGYFIAMEYVDGRDLRTILQAGRDNGAPLPTPLAVYIAAKVAAALDYAHRRRDHDGHELNIVHRDVSPQNILISFEGDIKLCDFGIAKAASKASQTQSGALKGKVQYMSPEQAWGQPLDRRSDLFSLGAVLCEMLTGEKLFRGDSDLTILEKVRAAEVAPPSQSNPDVPRTLDSIVLRALAREQEDRYANASDLLRDLEAVLYAYIPAPGSADLAIYLHRLGTEEAAAAEARQREAARARPPEEPDRKRRSKTAPLARRPTDATPIAASGAAASATAGPAAPPTAAPAATPPKLGPGKREKTASGVFGSFSSKRVEAEKKSRTPLYAMIAAAAVILMAGSVWLATRVRTARSSVAQAITPAIVTPLSMDPTPLLQEVVPLPTAPAGPVVDPRAVEQEVQRQLAAKRKELQKAIEENRAAAAASKAAPAAVEEQPTAAPEAPPPTEAPVARIEPTAVPTEAPAALLEAAPARPAPARLDPDPAPGDLVGPGPDVVEPALISTPRVTYPAIARQQRVSGKVIVLVLVGENGAVVDARLQQGLPTRTGVNEAVLQAVRNASFRGATKRGIPVKMWRTIVVDVRP
ncbi:MAG: TonB family protein [Thermoanaerobaculia bacterium]